MFILNNVVCINKDCKSSDLFQNSIDGVILCNTCGYYMVMSRRLPMFFLDIPSYETD